MTRAGSVVCLAALFLVGVIMFGVAVDWPDLEELWS